MATFVYPDEDRKLIKFPDPQGYGSYPSMGSLGINHRVSNEGLLSSDKSPGLVGRDPAPAAVVSAGSLTQFPDLGLITETSAC